MSIKIKDFEKLMVGQEYIFTIDGRDHIGVWQGIGISENPGVFESVAKILMTLICGKKVVCEYFIDHIDFVRINNRSKK